MIDHEASTGPRPPQMEIAATDATVALPTEGTTAEAPDRTQMAAAVECPVCHTTNPPGEVYCGDCGFLLSSTPGPMVEEEAAPVARLTDLSGREFVIRPGRNTVGRLGADILLTDPSVSRQHAVITLEERCTIEDVGSTNGTKVNGERLLPGTPYPLADGDEVAFGGVVLRIVLPEGVGITPEERAEIERQKAEEAAKALQTPASLVSEETGEVYPLPMGTTTVGRRSVNQIAFTGDIYVSGRHAEIHFDGETLTLTDVGSTNGTLVNGERVAPHTPVPLHDGDLVVMGQQRLRVRLQAVEKPEEPSVPEAPSGEETPDRKGEDDTAP